MSSLESSKLKSTVRKPRRLNASCDEFNFFFCKMVLRLEGAVSLKIMTYDLAPLVTRGHLFVYRLNDVVAVDKLNKIDVISYWDGSQINYALFVRLIGDELILLKWDERGKKNIFRIPQKYYWARLTYPISLWAQIKNGLFMI